MSAPKTGPLTVGDLRALWRSVADPSYTEPLERAGDGHGLEAHGQLWEQLARVSASVDAATQSMFIRSWSGQTGNPAAGEARATVTISLSRSKLAAFPLRLAAGELVVEEETTAPAPNAGVTVRTGRRYVLDEDVVFMPGEMGPLDVRFVAERPGPGYNEPRPGTLRHIPQAGRLFNNAQAAVVATGPAGLTGSNEASVRVTAADAADMFVPEHVGQQVRFDSGANAGKIAKVAYFVAPDPSAVPPVGSGVGLELLQVIDASVFAGTFVAGESVALANGGPSFATGRVVAEKTEGGVKKLAFDALRGDFSLLTPGTTTLTGAGSGATATVRANLFAQLFSSETPPPGAGWRVLAWDAGWGLAATNAAQPSGGRLGLLDELGAERNIHRAPSEADDVYRKRVAEIADVVTPNAVRRALSRALGTIPWCLREVGTELLPGTFYDGNLGAASIVPHGAVNDAYDTDVFVFTGGAVSGAFVDQEPVVVEAFPAPLLVKARGWFGRSSESGTVITIVRRDGSPPSPIVPGTHRVRGLVSGATYIIGAQMSTAASASARRFRSLFDYAEFRGFFRIGLPRLGMGEFGFAYDAGPSNAYDASPALAFYDGSPVGAAAVYGRVHRAVDPIRAGGVGFDLYLADETCAVPALPADAVVTDPLALPSLWAWLLADTGVATTVGDLVLSWQSQAPALTVFSAGGLQPSRVRNAAKFVRTAVRGDVFQRTLQGAREVFAAGLSIHAVLRTTSATTPSSNPGVVPPVPILGDSVLGVMSLGLNNGVAEYDYNGVATTGGAGLNGGSVITVGVTHDQATGNVRLFANGALVATSVQAYNPATTAVDTVFGLTIGDGFDGDLFELVVTKAVLPDATMTALHARAQSIW